MKTFSLLHIGKFYPPHRGGMETHVRDLAVRQAKVCSVKVIVANSRRRTEISEVEGIPVHRVASFATVGSMPICPGLTQAIRNAPADLVHLHMPNPGAAHAFLRSGHPGKIVLTHHADTLGRTFLRRFSDPFVKRLMDRASAIIVTSNRYLDTSPELSNYREKCRVIPLGIGMEFPTPTDEVISGGLRKKYRNGLILAVGRLVPYKGFDFLIRAMKHVNAHLILIGAGPQSEYLAGVAAREQVEDKLEMLGHVENLMPYLLAASLFVLPSSNRAEAFGMVQLEAMAAGLPVINTNIDSAVPEVCVNGETGLTIPPGDTAALVDAIRLLLERDDLRRQFGEAAKARVKARYTADLMAERTLSLYAEVLGLEAFPQTSCEAECSDGPQTRNE